TRDDGWRLLSIGRLIERLGTLSTSLAHAFATGAVHEAGGFAALLTLADSTITFHAQYQQRRDVPALLDLLVLDPENPRSLACVISSLRGRLDRLRARAGADLPDLAVNLPDPGDWRIGDFWSAAESAAAAPDEPHRSAHAFAQLAQAAADLSNTVGRRYFSHSATDSQSHTVGA
ncbi:MAG: alpha-E domain-containing protein, partial [Polaromonas sp.]|nr:alpha-E domain-containing protein [Polaromonas sp.]